MSEMVERVARAMVRSGCGHDRLWDELSAISKEHWRLQASAAISAMREPTDEMQKADEEMASYWDRSTSPPTLATKLGSHVGLSWEQMIDEALR